MKNPGLKNILSLVMMMMLVVVRGSAKWDLLLPNIGISAMHMQLLHTDNVVIFDRTDFGPSNISLPHGKCRDDPHDNASQHDCTAHSVQYDVASNSVRPLTVLTDVWCSSGAVLPDGTLAQAGGFNDGDRAVRLYKPCTDNSCDWHEISAGLTRRRWYATSHILPDGRQIVVGGRREFNYEFYPKKSRAEGWYNLPFLVQTNDPTIENNLYPFVFLNRDGNLFIFANNRAILFSYVTDTVVRSYPTMPGGEPRSYPSTGSAVLLPLRSNVGAQVMVCGGAPKGAFVRAIKGDFTRALTSCGRIGIDDLNPEWAMENMPSPRAMGDMILLPDANVLIINGAASGTAGWELGRAPNLTPLVYYPLASRFESQPPSPTPRMYHSSALLLPDGRVLVGGSNPHAYYNFTRVLFPTDLSLHSFSPSYLDPKFDYLRPRILLPLSLCKFGYGQRFSIRFNLPMPMPMGRRLDTASLIATIIAPSFTTHSFAMNQRLIVLDLGNRVAPLANSTYQVQAALTDSPNIAPPGYYLLFLVHQHIPSHAIWIQIH